MIRLTGLWLNTKKESGEKYFKGKLGTAEILIFKNKNKKDENDYDYLMYMDESKKLPVENIDEDVPL
jgi:hypothetical protein